MASLISCAPIEYVLTTPAAADPITAADVKVQARMDTTDTSEDAYLTTLIKAVVNLAESHMRRDIINKTYTAYLNAFPLYTEQGIKLERSKLQSLTSIQYYSGGVLTTFSSANYYTTFSEVYSSIFLVDGAEWPDDVDTRQQAIQIEFVAGMGADGTDIPEDIKSALKQHATFLYQDRGDVASGGFNTRIPDIAKAIYEQYKIYNLTI